MPSLDTSGVVREAPAVSPIRSWLVVCAALACALHLALPRAAAGLASAEPSFAGEVIPGVALIDRAGLTHAQESGLFPASRWRFGAVCAGLFAVYGAVLGLARRPGARSLTPLIYAGGALLLAVQVLTPIMLSTDVFAYALYGRVHAVYGANPYAASPPVPAGDPFLVLFGQDYLPSWYGPLWTFVSSLLVRLGGDHVGLTVLFFKSVTVFSALAAGALVWAILRRIAPHRASLGVALLLWNPLFVMETGLSAHNDAVMMALVLLGVWLHLRGGRIAAVFALTLSALIKFLTAMLIPLYIWMVLRNMPSWRERIRFAVLSVAVLAATWIGFERWSGKGSAEGAPVAQQAVAPDFYQNNFHELIFKGLRLALGEDAASVRAPIYFQGWWLAAADEQPLRSAPAPDAAPLRAVPAGQPVLVCAPQAGDWARVCDPVARGKGYVNTAAFAETARPAIADADPQARVLEQMTMEWPTVRMANAILRIVAWLLFAAFGLWAAWRTRDLESFLVWSAAALLASYFTIITEIWPWYVNWALAVAALAPHRRPAVLALLLSAGVTSLYVTMDFIGGAPAWVGAWRSVPAFLLPLALFFAYRRGWKDVHACDQKVVS